MNRMNNQSALKVYKSGNYEYIYIYFKLSKNILRINTRNQVVNNGMTKDLLYNSRVENYKKKNKKTLELKKLVDNYIRIKLEEYRPSVNQKELESIINDRHKKYMLELSDKYGVYGIDELTPKKTTPDDQKSLNELYVGYHNIKNKELNGSLGMLHYKSLYNALVDYQTYIGNKLNLNDVNNKEFVLDFRNFLAEERPQNENYISKGNLNNTTIDKRLKVLYRFFRYIERNYGFRFNPDLYDVKVDKYINDAVTLSNEEIKQLYNLKIEKPNWRKMVDTFVCNCYLGLRYSDLIKISKHDFQVDEDGDYFFVKHYEKTSVKVIIPIDPFALEILEKYDFQLPVYSNQYLNRELKKIFQHYNLFNGTIIRIKKKINNMKDYKKKKWELIGTHTGRRTFITLSIKKKIPLNTIMLASGHKKLETLQGYIAKVADKKAYEGLSVV